ncbi:ribosomal protein RSM22 (predicted rRNA methylase) [Kribbella antiqua]|uniref:Ribosomal protein RSM22 (Predicted rRNA methylase) n=1 Tax=Kribbella antiqua TaxID=2512217 RepID=A0A4R2J2G5_9ACTN|nr:small ribosomal subunit Rsm22 family protein [Kribbella antiqua]TCO51068.1 ribosomal protein RSM22 (predicted rRNA methylase) [Kribbella antiqua]
MSASDTSLDAALRQILNGVKYDALRARITTMSNRYRTELVDDTTPGMADDLDCLAYAVFRMPATYRAIRSVLQAAAVSDVRTHLDLGGGTGAAAWAAADIWPTVTTEIVERQPTAIRLGRRLAEHLADGNQTWTTADLRRWTPNRRVDLITIAYVLNELTDSARDNLMSTAANTADTVVVVEPGTPRGHRRILEARDQLIHHGLTIAAPCPHQLACPLSTSDWCHFAVRLPRTELHRAAKGGTRNFEDEKFAYVVATRRPTRRPEARIIARPSQPKGRVVLDLCTAKGTRQRETIAKSSPSYRAARSAAWGDGW